MEFQILFQEVFFYFIMIRYLFLKEMIFYNLNQVLNKILYLCNYKIYLINFVVDIFLYMLVKIFLLNLSVYLRKNGVEKDTFS